MNAREAILGRLADGEMRSVPMARPKTRFGGEDLWAAFERNLISLGGKVLAAMPDLEDKLVWAEEGNSSAKDIWSAEVGISRAEFAIAETGTLVFRSGSNRERLSSLVPPVNLVLVSEIVGTYQEGIAKLGDRNVVLVTGPSRTADIEGVLVRGVHGPGELWVVRV